MKFTRRKNGLMMANRIITVVLAEDAVVYPGDSGSALGIYVGRIK